MIPLGSSLGDGPVGWLLPWAGILHYIKQNHIPDRKKKQKNNQKFGEYALRAKRTGVSR